MNHIYLLLGSNMGNCKKQLSVACKHIAREIGHITRASALYSTAAWGKNDQPDFLNQVIILDTPLPAEAVMHCILAIEEKMGRIRTKKYDPRIIDIDILFFNKAILQTETLCIPHPQIQNRRFVLVPLNELSPNLIHPVLQKTIHQLLRVCQDSLPVKKN